jgi:hypothetical protein
MSNPIHRASHRPKPAARTIGQLCVGGDWACAHGDLEALGDVAERLADYANDPLHDELEALSVLCHNDPERAATTWMRLKNQLLRSDHLSS